MQYPTATKIPSLFRAAPLWLVEMGPTVKDRYQVEAIDGETALAQVAKARA